MFITRKKFEAAIAQAKEEAANEVYRRVDEAHDKRWMVERIEGLEKRVSSLERGKNCVRPCADIGEKPTLPI